MAATERKGIFATKPVDRLVEDTHEKDTELRRAVGALDLTALGLGAIIGTGIFVIIGEAITTSGPSIILAFVLAGVTCAFSALASRSWRPRSRSRAAPTPTPTRRSGSSPRGSSAGT